MPVGLHPLRGGDVVGAQALAMIWDSAWLGDGDDIGDDLLVAVNEEAVRDRYIDNDFVPSRTLNEMDRCSRSGVARCEHETAAGPTF